MAKSTPAPVATDPNEGLGGSYVINPETGRRELVERTQEPGTETAAQPTE